MENIKKWSVRFEDFVTGEILERCITEFPQNMICPEDKVAQTNEMLIDTVIITIGKMAVYGFDKCAITVCWGIGRHGKYQYDRKVFETFDELKDYYKWLIK